MLWKSGKEALQPRPSLEFEKAAAPNPPVTPEDFLMRAVLDHDPALLQDAIVNKKADVNAKGGMPLIWAAIRENEDILHDLAAAGADVNLSLRTLERETRSLVEIGIAGIMPEATLFSMYRNAEANLRHNKANLLETSLTTRVKALEEDRDKLQQQVADLQEKLEELTRPAELGKPKLVTPKN